MRVRSTFRAVGTSSLRSQGPILRYFRALFVCEGRGSPAFVIPPRNSCSVMAPVSLMILSLRHTTHIGCVPRLTSCSGPPTCGMSVLIAPEEADACSLGALTERCLCKIAHSQDHPSMPLYQLTDRHRRARLLGGCRGDRPSNGLSRATSSGLYERGDGCQVGCRSRNFPSANVFFQFPTPHFIAAAQNRRRTKVFIPTVAAGIAELCSLRYLSFPKIISGRIGGAARTRLGWRQ